MRNKRVSDFSILESLVQHKKIGKGGVFRLIEIIELNDFDSDVKTQSCNKIFNSGSDIISFKNKKIWYAFVSQTKTAGCS